MEINRAAIKADARQAMLQAKPNVFFFTLLYIVVGYILSTLSMRMTGTNTGAFMELIEAAEEPMGFAVEYADMSPLRMVLFIAIDLMSITVSAGFLLYCLCSSRRIACTYGTLLDGFGIFLRLIALEILMGVFVLLWSLLFIIPGIIAGYRYRLALYLLLDHPEYSPLECIRLSKKLMQGRKMELFMLDLSTIGWRLLTLIPLTSLYVSPYLNITYCNYYNAVLSMQTEIPLPVWEQPPEE